MARPSELPGWGGLTLLVAPSPAKRTLGWLFQGTPPANFFNWFWNLISLWVAYFDAKTNGTFEIRISPKTPGLAIPVQFGPGDYLASPGWTVTKQFWDDGTVAQSIQAEPNGLAHQLRHFGVTALIGNLIFAGDKIQLTNIALWRNHTLGLGDLSIVFSELDENTGVETVLLTLSDGSATTGFELTSEDNGGIPIDLDLSKNIQITVDINPNSGANIVEISQLILTFQVVPV